MNVIKKEFDETKTILKRIMGTIPDRNVLYKEIELAYNKIDNLSKSFKSDEESKQKELAKPYFEKIRYIYIDLSNIAMEMNKFRYANILEYFPRRSSNMTKDDKIACSIFENNYSKKFCILLQELFDTHYRFQNECQHYKENNNTIFNIKELLKLEIIPHLQIYSNEQEIFKSITDANIYGIAVKIQFILKGK